MPGRRERPQDLPPRRRAPATTPEARENQIIADAYDLAEKQIRDGTASAQVISHFLKAGSSRDKLERARLEKEVDLMESKIEQLASQKRVEELYADAMEAMRGYTGNRSVSNENYDD